MGISNAIEEYFKLRTCVDKEVTRLRTLHADDITCRPGCAACCVNLTVFPVEFHAILHELNIRNTLPRNIPFNENTACGFLDGRGMCLIYPYRPIICRTHGLPILFLDDSADTPSWEVSFCELNFRDRSQIEFSDNAVLDTEEINMELNRINREFIDMSGSELSFTDRIPLRNILKPDQS